MKTLLSALALALVALVATDRAQAASLNVVTRNSPVIDIPGATADYLVTDGVGDLSIFGAEGLVSGTSQAGTLLLDIFLDFDVGDRDDIEIGRASCRERV